MDEEIRQAIKAYQERYPEVEEILRKFGVSQEVYNKAVAAISIKVRRQGPTCIKSTEGSYNVHVSGTAR